MYRDYRKNSIFKEFTTTGLVVIGAAVIIFYFVSRILFIFILPNDKIN